MITPTWKLYENGKDHKRRLGLYERVRENERFYRGDQWHGVNAENLPKPVFNVVRRVIDFLVCSVAADRYTITYTDEDLPFKGEGKFSEDVKNALALMTRNAAYRWEKCRMDDFVYSLLLDAAISGDGVAYCYWDADAGSGIYRGDIAVQGLDSVNLFVADMNRADIQSQEYVILAGRCSVEALRREARKFGLSEREISKIRSDDDYADGAGDHSLSELSDGGDGKATYLVRFFRENGRVVYEKSVRECVLCRIVTDCKLYPVAYFSWNKVKNSFHGASPISEMIPSQKYINRAYAMVMKHMTDSAFSKVIYDKSRIPEWNGGVGEAIAVVGAPNVSDTVDVIPPGKMEGGYLGLIENAISTTKELMGATETALGNTAPTNTSAILALRESSKLSLGRIERALSQCLEDIANIWMDMMCAYYPADRLLAYRDGEKTLAAKADFPLLKSCLIRARVDVGESERYSASATLDLLDKLLEGGFITLEEYLEHMPSGILPSRRVLLANHRGEVTEHERE